MQRIVAIVAAMTVLVGAFFLTAHAEQPKGPDIPQTIAEMFWLTAKVESDHQANPKPSPGTEWEQARGIVQIRPIMVKEVNRILRLKKSKKRYTLEDRLSVQKSQEMYTIYMRYWGPRRGCIKGDRVTDIRRATCLWNSISKDLSITAGYWKKIERHVKAGDWRPRDGSEKRPDK